MVEPHRHPLHQHQGVLQATMISAAAPPLHPAPKVKVTVTSIVIAQVIWSVELITVASLMQPQILQWIAV